MIKLFIKTIFESIVLVYYKENRHFLRFKIFHWIQNLTTFVNISKLSLCGSLSSIKMWVLVIELPENWRQMLSKIVSSNEDSIPVHFGVLVHSKGSMHRVLRGKLVIVVREKLKEMWFTMDYWYIFARLFSTMLCIKRKRTHTYTQACAHAHILTKYTCMHTYIHIHTKVTQNVKKYSQ